MPLLLMLMPPSFAAAREWTTGPLPLVITPVSLQHLDLVAIGVLHEKEACHQPAIAVEFLDGQRADAEVAQPFVLAIQIGNGERHMAVAIAQLIGLGAA